MFLDQVTDFGLSRDIDDNTGRAMTSTNTVRGTPSYMSPEQWRRGSVTHKADVYAYGLLVLELFTGRELTWTGLPAEFEDVKGREQAKRSWCVQPPHKRPQINLFCAKRGYPLVAPAVFCHFMFRTSKRFGLIP